MKSAQARLLAGLLVGLVSSATALPAYADGPPPADTTNLTPPEPPPSAIPPAPPASAEAAPSTQPVELLPGSHPSKLAAYIFAGVSVVGVGVGTAFGILALHNQSNYNANATGSSLGLANQDSVVADLAFGAAVIAGVTSVVLFLEKDDAPAKPAASSRGSDPTSTRRASSVSFTVTPIMTPHGAGAGAVLRF